MNSIQDRIETALAEHRRDRGYRGLNAHCACGWKSPERGESILRHEEHVAAMLAPLIRESQAKVLTEFADAHRMPQPLFMDDGRAVTVGDLLREKAAQLRSNDGCFHTEPR